MCSLFSKFKEMRQEKVVAAAAVEKTVLGTQVLTHATFQQRLPDSLMLEIFPSMSAGSDKPRNGLISKVEGGNSSSGKLRAFRFPEFLG